MHTNATNYPNLNKINKAAVCALIILVALAYSNTLDASWHLDDYHTIPNNPAVQISEINYAQLMDSINAHPVVIGRIYRPVAMLSFALNWYWAGDQVFFYHLINITIHLITTLVLILTIKAIFRSPRLCEIDLRVANTTALIAAAFWSLNPVQIQAVTYIVQRMASLAALFYLLAILFYIQARLTKGASLKVVLLLSGCLIAFGLSIGSKENGLTLPLALMLVEWVFFRALSIPRSEMKLRFIPILVAVSVGIVLLWFLFYSWGDLFALASKLYEHRPFTLSERVLTQARVIWFYLGLLFYPLPHRLSIEHDFALSVAWNDPWTTPLAIAGIVFGILLATIRLKKNPLLSFAFIFFLLTHSVESSVFPLEILFEHRNYLPSLFLFLPISFGMASTIHKYSERKKNGALPIIGLIMLIVISLGTATYLRNSIWRSELTLWDDARRKSPDSPRPLVNLAVYHFEPEKRVDVALGLTKKALVLAKKGGQPDVVLTCIRNIAGYHFRSGRYEEALSYFERGLTLDPNQEELLWGRAQTLAALGRWKEANDDANTLLAINPQSETGLLVKGYVAVKQNNLEQANKYLITAFSFHPDSSGVLIALATVCNLQGQYSKAEEYLKIAVAKQTNDPYLMIRMVENAVLRDDLQNAKRHTQKWIDTIGLEMAEAWLSALGSGLSLPLADQRIDSFVRRIINEQRNKLPLSQ